MTTLIFTNPIPNSITQFPPSIFFLSISQKDPKKFSNFSPRKQFHFFKFKKPISYIKPLFSTRNSLDYGGWDDLRLGIESLNSGESTQLTDFIKIDENKKYIFVFILGVLCAFSVSRVRISSIIVFPASVLIFGVGFSFGFFRGGSLNEFTSNASKKKVKDEIFRVYSEKLRSLLGFFDGFEVRVGDLKNDIVRVIDSKEIELEDLDSYVGAIDSIRESALRYRNIVESSIDSIGSASSMLVENQKSSSKKKKEIGEVGFELLQFVGRLFGEKLVDSKPIKVKDKDSVKQSSSVRGWANDQSQRSNKGLVNDQRQINSSTRIKFDHDKGYRRSVYSQGLKNEMAFDWDSERRIRIVSENGEMDMEEIVGNKKRFIDGQGYSYQSSRLQFVDNQRVSWKKSENNVNEIWNSHENMHDSVDFNLSFKHMETETSFTQEQMSNQSGAAYKFSNSRKVNENESYGSQFKENGLNGETNFPDHPSVMEGEVGSSSSSMLADDMVFDRYLSEANNLLKQAKEYIKGKHDEEHAEIILNKSAKLLSKALVMKPMSLLAVGLLGNTYLLHGELKLKISRELRTLLLRRDPLSVDSRGNIFKDQDKQVSQKEKIASALIDVCEECEELLVEAGRKYRLALSIDGNDVRALYNWGLALSFRAQLIADIGPEAAFDADKIFLAAIDKFDAMMSKGNTYAPDALYRWGVVLQQRSRLRPRNSKEKTNLLMQAKRLYEDALDMDYDNPQVREAISSCVAELNRRRL